MATATAWVRDPDGNTAEISGEGADWETAKAAVTIPDGHQVIAWVNPDR